LGKPVNKNSKSAKGLTFIIPVYNEEKSIGKVIEELLKTFPSSEIIVVNDGSTDSTGEILKKYNIKVITHPTNKGYGASLKTGILASNNENLIFIDGDGQHKVEYILKIIEELNTYDMVVGARSPSDSTFGRKPGKLILKWIAQILTGQKIPDLNSGLRGIKKSVIKKYLHLLPQGFSASTTNTLSRWG